MLASRPKIAYNKSNLSGYKGFMSKSAAEYVSTFLLEFLLGLLPQPVDSAAKASIRTFTDQLDLLLAQPRIQSELLDAARNAETDFRAQARQKMKNDELAQAIASFPLWDRELFQSTLRGLPNHLDEDLLAQDLESYIADDWKGKFTPAELREGAVIYLNCLRIHLLKVKGFGELVTQLATLRIDDRTTSIQSSVQELLRRTEKKSQNTARIQIVVEGSLRGFTASKKEEMLGVLSEVLKVDKDQIRILRVSSGSIVIELELPENAANELHKLYQNGESRLADLGVSSVIYLDHVTHVRNLGNLLENLADDYMSFGDLDTADLPSEAPVSASLGGAYMMRAELHTARFYYQRAAEITSQLGDWGSLCDILEKLGAVLCLLGDFQDAISTLHDAEVVALRHNDRVRTASVLGSLGVVYARLGDHLSAIRMYEQARSRHHPLVDRREGVLLINLGFAFMSVGNYNEAIESYEEGLIIFRNLGDRMREGIILNNLGVAFRLSGNDRKAMESHEQSIVIYREIGARQGEASALRNLGIVSKNLGDLAKAREFLEQALAINPEIEKQIPAPFEYVIGISKEVWNPDEIDRDDEKDAIEKRKKKDT
jgi:tetratricopeptide (TPR) repeat protein